MLIYNETKLKHYQVLDVALHSPLPLHNDLSTHFLVRLDILFLLSKSTYLKLSIQKKSQLNSIF